MRCELLSSEYEVRKIVNEDIPDVVNLCEGNPLYYKYCPPAVSSETIKESLIALPPRKTGEDKYYLGFYKSKQLVALIDLICKYPDDSTIFIGFFMVHRDLQGTGLGTKIISDCSRYLKTIGYSQIRLAYVKNNPQAKEFWRKNLFKPTGIEEKQDQHSMIVMEKIL